MTKLRHLSKRERRRVLRAAWRPCACGRQGVGYYPDSDKPGAMLVPVCEDCRPRGVKLWHPEGKT